MTTRTTELLSKFLEIQNYLMKTYKNVAYIQGQYDVKIKTISTVMVNQYKKKIHIYETMLTEVTESTVDTSPESFKLIFGLLQNRQEKNKKIKIEDYKVVTKVAYDNSTDVIDISNQILQLIDKEEGDRSKLRSVLMTLLDIEIKDNKLLKHIVDSYDKVSSES